MRPINKPNLLGGLIVIGISLPFALEAGQLLADDPGLTGPGAFPAAVAVVSVMIGLVLCGLSLRNRVPSRIKASYRAPAAVLAAVISFTLMIKSFGMMPTLFVVTLIAAFGSRQGVSKRTVWLAMFMAVFGWLVFSVGLGMTIPAARIPL
ncbi:uncharacterized BrkB/YihY/UPF0761 family membrane protein [Pseudorhizobium tarimense]|uniref:Uncharacterized BrkB/YihY/UPF0761 family membrane protein n=1 Tax=Pseudorhizobium tarimense TaxID=1079109 RepID=A0ABV2HBQ7_9HYPH|nr:tripartite tricarboxylate transporter TctB family protein [Pseudorhizobium tarimense]MCJ8520939.1 tripartite tricarboxylate transporter TctB family protein [Pseudorhizobium tarimense]